MERNVRQPEIGDASRANAGPRPHRAGYGLKTLYDPQGSTAEVDIIAVHGLNGHWESTFTADNGICWLKSLLPSHNPNIRVLSYGYDARTHDTSPLSQEHLHNHAEQLVEELWRKRTITETTRRPIIFIGHCLGGLIIKAVGRDPFTGRFGDYKADGFQALVLSASYSESHLPDRNYIKTSTYGILFMGTPHQGNEGVTWGKLAWNLASMLLNTNREILEHLSRNSEWLEYQQTLFLPISSQFETVYFYETLPTPLPSGGTLIIVPRYSACLPGAVDAPRISIDSDHINMVKFESAEDEGFYKVNGELSIMLKKVSWKIKEHWERLERAGYSNRPGQARHPDRPSFASLNYDQIKAQAMADQFRELEQLSGYANRSGQAWYPNRPSLASLDYGLERPASARFSNGSGQARHSNRPSFADLDYGLERPESARFPSALGQPRGSGLPRASSAMAQLVSYLEDESARRVPDLPRASSAMAQLVSYLEDENARRPGL